MSELTKAALDAAIAAHVADEYDDDMVTGWVVVCEATSIDRLTSGGGTMIIESRELQSLYLTVGLLHEALTLNSTDGDAH